MLRQSPITRDGGGSPRPTARRYTRRLAPFSNVALPRVAVRLAVAGGLTVLALGGTITDAAAHGLAPVELREARASVQVAAGTGGNCTLLVPDAPLTARGLATPYQLSATNPRAGACHEADPLDAAFVQGAVLDPAKGTISIYNPLVTDRGVQPAVTPVTPNLPPGAIVALWFGFNGGVLHLAGARTTTLASAGCVNGLPGSPFGQVAYCNAVPFFLRADQLIRAGMLHIPTLGTAIDGKSCPTVRDFAVVDQDPSDNVTTSYLVTSNGRTAQNTTANAAELTGASVATNASDNRLLAVALDHALGCSPWTAPDLANAGTSTTALPLNELQAAQMQAAPVATVPSDDPMTLVNGRPSLAKQNLYRAGVDQPPLTSVTQAQAQMQSFCSSLVHIAPARMQQDESETSAAPSPSPSVATTLYTFVAQRFVATFGAGGLNCAGLLHQSDPVSVTTNDSGVAVAVTISMRK